MAWAAATAVTTPAHAAARLTRDDRATAARNTPNPLRPFRRKRSCVEGHRGTLAQASGSGPDEPDVPRQLLVEQQRSAEAGEVVEAEPVSVLPDRPDEYDVVGVGAHTRHR